MLKFTSADSGSEDSLITSPTMYFLIPAAQKRTQYYCHTHASGVDGTQHTYTHAMAHVYTICIGHT